MIMYSGWGFLHQCYLNNLYCYLQSLVNHKYNGYCAFSIIHNGTWFLFLYLVLLLEHDVVFGCFAHDVRNMYGSMHVEICFWKFLLDWGPFSGTNRTLCPWVLRVGRIHHYRLCSFHVCTKWSLKSSLTRLECEPRISHVKQE